MTVSQKAKSFLELWEHRAVTATRLFIMLLLALGLAALVGGGIFEHFNRTFWLGIVLAQGPIFMGIIFSAWRHRIMVATPVPPMRIAINSVVLASGLNYIIPGRIAELIKATYLREHAGVPLHVGVSAVILERLLDIIILALLGVVALVGLSRDYGLVELSASTVVMGLLLFALPRLVGSMVLLMRKIGQHRFASFFERVEDAVVARRTVSTLIAALVTGLLSWGAYITAVGLFIGTASNFPLDLVQVVLLFVGLAFGAALPIMPGGIGTFESVGALLLLQFGMPLSEATVLVIGLRLCNMALIIPGALIISCWGNTGLMAILRRASR